MKCIFLTFLIFISSTSIFAQTQTVHVFVALCDNINQGIVPVPSQLGNGQNPKSNLYWGAMFGVKSFLRYKSQNWSYVKSLGKVNSNVLERIIFKHKTKDVFLIADAYDGAEIKKCTEDFLLASNGQLTSEINVDGRILTIGGKANLLAYIGHDGLMEFDVDLEYTKDSGKPKNTIILACSSKDFFSQELKFAHAIPLLWTTNLMAPEAYTLEAAIEGWIENENGTNVKERAAQAYNKYQKCGINGARRLFATGF